MNILDRALEVWGPNGEHWSARGPGVTLEEIAAGFYGKEDCYCLVTGVNRAARIELDIDLKFRYESDEHQRVSIATRPFWSLLARLIREHWPERVERLEQHGHLADSFLVTSFNDADDTEWPDILRLITLAKQEV